MNPEFAAPSVETLATALVDKESIARFFTLQSRRLDSLARLVPSLIAANVAYGAGLNAKAFSHLLSRLAPFNHATNFINLWLSEFASWPYAQRANGVVHIARMVSPL